MKNKKKHTWQLIMLICGIFCFIFAVVANFVMSDPQIKGTVEYFNEMCPIEVDGCTTHKSVSLSGKNIVFKTVIADNCWSYTDFKYLKENIRYDMAHSLPDWQRKYIADKDYSFVYQITNERGNHHKKITITGKDLLNTSYLYLNSHE